MTKDGEIRYGHFDGTLLRDGTMDAREAANTPAETSLQRLAHADRQPLDLGNEPEPLSKRALAL